MYVEGGYAMGRGGLFCGGIVRFLEVTVLRYWLGYCFAVEPVQFAEHWNT